MDKQIDSVEMTTTVWQEFCADLERTRFQLADAERRAEVCRQLDRLGLGESDARAWLAVAKKARSLIAFMEECRWLFEPRASL